MVTDHNINIRLVPILDHVMTLQMITQKNMIPNWYNQFFTTCKVFIMLSGLTYELEACLLVCIIALSCWFNQIALGLKLSDL